MQKLPVYFKKYGYTFKLIVREAKKAIYAQYDNDQLMAYEVIKIRVRPQRYNAFLKRNEPEREIYPSKEQWGIMGGTYKTWKKAMEKYSELENNKSKK